MQGTNTHSKSLRAGREFCKLLAPIAFAASRKVSTVMLSASATSLSAAASCLDFCSIETN